ncbi:hypothetical protein ACH42_05025 [Endozoicomonas sp. (ex Bugula neritina AB1)]|nr:hypothetical protein ACH42_05025 [Endozoicomonas sp. (ex Bugula neritina AB1)]
MVIQIRYLIATFLMLLSLTFIQTAKAATAYELNAEVKATLEKLYHEKPAARELAKKAKGILVFPTVIKGGFFIGGEFGEGTLLINNKVADYYNTASASIGLQAGAQARSQVILFMTSDALKKFRNSEGWEAGVDGSVAIAEFGTGGAIDSQTAQEPIIGFITDNKGLMYNLTLEGSKITKISK